VISLAAKKDTSKKNTETTSPTWGVPSEAHAERMGQNSNSTLADDCVWQVENATNGKK